MSKAKSVLAAYCLGLACLYPTSESSAQTQPGSVGAEIIRRALLSPGIWLLNWPDTSAGFLTGNATLRFEASGQGLVVRIQNLVVNTSCERPVTVTAQSVAFDGCREVGIVLRFTPDDPVFAFRGESPQRWYTLRPHQ